MQCVRDTMGGRWLYQNKKMFKDLAEWLPEFHKTGSKLFVQLSAGMGRSMAINEIMVKMLQNKAFGAVGKPFLNVDYITASASATPQPLVSRVQIPPSDRGGDPRDGGRLCQDRQAPAGCRR